MFKNTVIKTANKIELRILNEKDMPKEASINEHNPKNVGKRYPRKSVLIPSKE